MIRIEHLRKEFDESVPLKDVNLTVNEGDVIAIIGPSGTGKSTLLRSINLLNIPTSGKIFIDEEEITAPDVNVDLLRRKVGMVFQSFNLFGQQTVIENIMQPQIDLLGRSKQEAYDRAVELLEKVNLKGKEFKYPDMISGGQKQRVAIARALAMDPDIILFDEPTSALDPTMVGEVVSVIRQLAREGRTMLIVTHEMSLAKDVATRICYLDKGIVYEEGTPEEIFEHPKEERTAAFVRQLRTLELEIIPGEYDFADATGSIIEYTQKNRIGAKDAYRICSVMEELCQQILLPVTGTETIRFSVEHVGVTGETTIRVTYGGEVFDPRTSDNELSLKVLRGLCGEPEHTCADGINTVTIRI